MGRPRPPGPPALRPHPSQDRPLEAPRASFRKVVLALGGKAPLVPFLLILCSSLMLPCPGESVAQERRSETPDHSAIPGTPFDLLGPQFFIFKKRIIIYSV